MAAESSKRRRFTGLAGLGVSSAGVSRVLSAVSELPYSALCESVDAHVLSDAMGSLPAWVPCIYCDYEVFNPYLHDPDGHALCDWCFDFLFDDGGEPESAAHWWSNYQHELENCVWCLQRQLLPLRQRLRPIALLTAEFLVSSMGS